MAAVAAADGSRGMPSIVWFILGLLVAGLLGGGTFVLFRETTPPGAAYDKLSPAEKEQKLKSIIDDLPEDPVKVGIPAEPAVVPAAPKEK